MKPIGCALLLLASLCSGLPDARAAAPTLPAATSRPIPGASHLVYRLAWVDVGQCLRSGAVVVNGDHLADAAARDHAAVLAAYQSLRRQYGVAAVVNLREEAAEDREAATSEGMAYLHLPIADGRAPTPLQVARFFDFVLAARRKKQVVLWHCAGGIGRTGVLAAMWRLREGWTTQQAATEMFAMGLNHDQAVEHLPALNAFAVALGKPGYYPLDWSHDRQSPHDYRAIVKKLPPMK